LSEDSPPTTLLFKSRCWSKDGKRIVATNDGSVEVKKEPPP
jgi:hypothetical protein